ncbi:MAG: sigma-54-dependent transcriptional regulator [Candidatus Binatia bacterium]
MEEKKRIFVFDDEPDMAECIGLILARAGYECNISSRPSKIRELIAENQPDLILTDLRMPDLDGMEVLELVKKEYPSLPVIIVTGYATVDAAVEAMKNGAADFMSKPFHSDELLVRVGKALNHSKVLDEILYLRQELQRTLPFSDIVGKSEAMKKVFESLERLKETECRVLLTGESGTGKEVIARAIHRMSSRRDEKFFAINCAALTEALLESELFGHERGAFTGAIASKKGLFELADRGTLYLDEVADTSLAFQAKLLRVVEENEFRRVGGTKTLKPDVRLIASTNKDLEKEISKGLFREDLFYRLCVVHLDLPPLRERKEDIPLLVDYFLKKLSNKMAKRIEGISKETMDILLSYNWPGNIRELENAMERGMIMTSGNVLRPEDFPLRTTDGGEIRGLSTLEELEKELIAKTLIECNWNKSRAAKRIGIGRRTLYEKAMRLGIPLKPDGE